MPEKNPIISPRGTLIAKAVGLDFYVSNILFRVLFVLIWLLGILAVIILGVDYFSGGSQVFLPSFGAGRASLFAGIFVAYLPIRAFYRVKVCYPKSLTLAEVKARLDQAANANLFAVFSFELAKATNGLFGRRRSEASSSDLLRAILKSKNMDFILVRLGISKLEMSNLLKDYKSEVPASRIILESIEVALAEKHHQIEVGDVFVALCNDDPLLQKMLEQLKLETADVANIVYWQTSLVRKYLEGRRFLDPGRFKFTGGVGRDWAYGYTPLLNQYALDLTQQIQSSGLGLEVVGREKEVQAIEEALSKSSGGGVILVGEAGIGKRTTVLGLARRIAHGQVGRGLAFKHLFELDIDSLLSGTGGGGDTLARINQLFNEILQAGNAIIFVENIHNLLEARGAGSANAAEVLISTLDRTSLKVIGTTDVANYNQLIGPNTALSSRFTRVTVEESTDAETVRILEDTVPIIEDRTGSVVSYEAIKETVKLANKYIVDAPNPEKSITLLDGAVAHATSDRHETIIMPGDIMDYISIKYNVPTSQVGEGEKQKLLSLEEQMHTRVIGQDEAIRAIASAMKRVRAGVQESKKPIGSFLFLGPTGVGKTETAKALAASYFGSSENMIRFDMSEYQNQADIYRLIGSNIGGEIQPGTLTTAVREHPFSLLLFDEIEKANPNILDLFLQILDEGHLTDGNGRKVLFTNTIIICTSNAGANLIRQSIQNNIDYESVKKSLFDYLQQENIYRPEFLNRFTQVVAFSPLSEADITKVAGLMLTKVKETVERTRRVSVDITPEAVGYLAKLGFDPEMGARPMARTIEEKVENLLADKILKGQLKEGDSMTIGVEDVK